jgi:copper(I)-binding protein
VKRAALAIAGCMLCASAWADVKLENGWLRPAYAGQAAAMVYVDIESTRALKLVGASSPVARAAELVLVEPPGSDPSKHKVVRELPVAAKQATRLAYLGSHVRLLDIRQDLKPGDAVPLTLTFADGKGKQETRTTEAKVRGITVRKPAS